MFGLGQPGLWFLLLFALVPVIIHLIQRFRLKKHPYSSLFFLTESKRETFSWFKLKEILLLCLRTLFIFFLMFSLAKPFIRKNTGLGQTWGNRIVIIDDSYSMGYGKNFVLAKNYAQSLIRELKKGSKCAIITSSGSVSTGLSGNLTGLIKLLDTISISYSPATLENAFEKALNITNQSSNNEIFIITDLQERAMLPLIKYRQNIKWQIPATNIVDVGRIKNDNVGIVKLSLSPSLVISDVPVKPKLALKNYSSKNQQRKIVLMVNEITSASSRKDSRDVSPIELNVELKPNESKEITFDREISMPGRYQIKAEVTPDSLPFDDSHYLAFSIAEKIPILLLYENEADIYYIEKALRQSNFDITSAPLSTLPKQNLKRYKAIGLFSPTTLSYWDWQRIRSFWQDGGGIFISFANEIKEKQWQKILGFDSPFLNIAEGSFRSAANGFWTIAQIDTTSPILEVFSKNDFSSAKFFSYWEPKAPPLMINKEDGQILAQFSSKSPFLLMPKERCLVAFT
ncbi:MAG: BatA domain-containing protein, partial [candidate division WOR-3 bacterium]|nr:BatA domain-containing protein [candidate division WOR-3 bacterium]